MKQADIALTYARQGIPVFPCNQNKRPVTENGHKDASLDESQIKRWWRKNPNWLIGSPNTNFTVLDIDDHGVCPAGKMLTDNALFRLFEQVPETSVVVKTMSGGRHFYFKKNSEIKRRINALPNIDLLGEGGFVILPDQKKYIANIPLWENIDKLPEFPLEHFNKLSKEMDSARKIARELKFGAKNKTTKTKLSKKDVENFKENPLSILVKKDEKTEGIDYKTGQMSFPQTNELYEKTTKEYEVDQDILFKFKNGKLHIKAGELTSKSINTLFHYPPIQVMLARHMGLRVPETEHDRELMHSILPGHPDVKPSMGVRWSRDGSHLLIRDFSNHFCDSYNQIDYNIVRLYCTLRYKTLVPRLKAPEFVVWFLRMLVEAGIIDISKLKKKYSMPRFGFNGIWKVAEGLKTLDAIKQLYSGYDGKTVFADKFCAAWCGVEPSTANRAKKALIEGGYFFVDGVYDCSGGTRDDGFYNSKLLSIIDKAKIKEINKDKKNREVLKMAKEHVTLRGFSISEPSYEIVKNFCADYFIDSVPLRKNMFVETSTITGLVQKEPPVNDGSFVISNLRLAVAPAMGGTGEVLMITGDSKELEDIFMEDIKKFEDEELISEEPLIGVVICSEYDGNKLDIDTLELRLRDYLQDQLVLDTFFVRYGTSESIFGYVFDGKEPPGE